MEVATDVDTLAWEAARLFAADQHALLDRIVDALASTVERQVARASDEQDAHRAGDLNTGRATPAPWREVE